MGKFDAREGPLEKFMPQSDFVEHFLRKENDPRAITAKRFYDEVPSGIVRLHKTARAGATVALCSESIRRKELFTLICRTNRNVTKTVKEETASVVGCPVNVIHIMRNSSCPRIQEQIRKHPSIERLGFIPLPDCDSCNMNLCPVREAFETPIEKVQGYSLTYAKLQSLMLSRSKKVVDLLDKLASQSKNIIFDEAQMLQEGTTVAVSLWEKKTGFEHILDLGLYTRLGESSPVIQRFLRKVKEIVDSVQPEIEKLRNESAVDHHLKHLASSVQSPAHGRAMEKRKELRAIEAMEKAEREKLQNLHPDKSWIEIAEMMRPYPEALEEVMKEDIPFGEIVKIQELLINAIQEPKEYGLAEEHIITLSKLLLIVNADFFTVSYVRGLDGEQISLQAQDTLIYRTLQAFISKALENSGEKRIVFTTATFGSLKFEKILRIENISDYIWGDPLNTSSKLLVVADKSRISPYNFTKKLQHVKDLIKAIIDRYGPENVEICTMNREWSRKLGISSTWYGSDLTEGVASRKRIWVFVGLAEKPVNAKDHLAILQAPYHDNPLDLQAKEFLHYVSQKLRADSVHISTYQAISRAKDPEAKSRSIATMIGAREEEVQNCLLWGPSRTLKPQKTEKGLKFDVDVQGPIGKPLLTVVPLGVDIEESLHIIDQWISYGKIASYKLNWICLKKLVDAKGYVGAKRLIKAYRMDENEVKQFFNGLPEFFSSQGINDYVLMRNSQGAIKAIATRQSYGEQAKSIILYNRSSQLSIGLTSSFIAIKAAVDRAPMQTNMLSSRYVSHHVSSSIYARLSEYFDALQLYPQLCPGWIVVGEKGEQREGRRLIRDIHCLGAWSPTFPRRACKSQFWANSMDDLERYASGPASRSDFFVSVYSFPDQTHPSQGGNPPIDTLFMDLDLESERFSELRRAWEGGDNTVLPELLALRKNLLSNVLNQARTLVDYLMKHNLQPRILLSGFKGVHLFIDFPAVQFSSLDVAKLILSKLTGEIKAETSVAFDPTIVGDVSRLCRIPNTQHFDASRLLGRPQYAVPVTPSELMDLTPEGYDNLCSASRFLSILREESNEFLAMLTRIEQDMDLDEVAVTMRGAFKDSEKLEAYERECIREILADEDFDDLDVRPCFKKTRHDRISLDGTGGHLMRIGAVMELASRNLSIASIIRWFEFCKDYDPGKTEAAVKDIISRGYTDKHADECGREFRKGLKCITIDRCGFCLGEACHVYSKKPKRR
jgi:hypothetical protein